MKKPLIFKLQCELYPHSIVFCIGPRPTDDDVVRMCLRYGLWNGKGKPPESSDGQAFTLWFDCGCFVWLPAWTKKGEIEWMGHFVHELCHILTNASHHMGIFMDKHTDEFHAYYAGWITNEVLKRTKK